MYVLQDEYGEVYFIEEDEYWWGDYLEEIDPRYIDVLVDTSEEYDDD